MGTDFIHEVVGSEGTPDSVNPSVVDEEEEEEEEEGLPSPPLDDFFATQPTSMELSQVHFIGLNLLGKVIFFRW